MINEIKCTVTCGENDFPHSVLKVALAKYMEKFKDAEMDEEGLEAMRKDIVKFLTRMVKTTAEVNVTFADDLLVSFDLVHELK